MSDHKRLNVTLNFGLLWSDIMLYISFFKPRYSNVVWQTLGIFAKNLKCTYIIWARVIGYMIPTYLPGYQVRNLYK